MLSDYTMSELLAEISKRNLANLIAESKWMAVVYKLQLEAAIELEQSQNR